MEMMANSSSVLICGSMHYYYAGVWVVLSVLGVLMSTAAALTFSRMYESKNSSLLCPPVAEDPIPVLGVFSKFVRSPVPYFEEQYKKLGSVFTLNLVVRKLVVLVGPEMAEYFFKEPESLLSQGEVYGFTVGMFGRDVLFDVDFNTRKEQIGFAIDSFRGPSIKAYAALISEEVEQFLIRECGDEGEMDLVSTLDKLVFLTSTRCLLGIEIRKTMLPEFSKIVRTLEEGLNPVSILLPWLPTATRGRTRKAHQELEEMLKRIMEKRKANGIVEVDIMQSLMTARYSSGRALTVREITGLLIALIFAGTRTSAIAAAWMGAYLLNHREHYNKACDEQKQIMDKHGDVVTYDTLNKMSVLRRCFRETLRLVPSITMLLRYVRKNFTISTPEGNTYLIPKGYVLATSPYVTNRLPQLYTNSESFDPDRHAPGREEGKETPLSFLSFGAGRHVCPGEHFAHIQETTIWAILLRKYEMKLISPFPEIDFASTTLGMKGQNLMIQYKKRSLLA